MKPPARRWLAPEVVQSSAMDCGPAALKSLLEGFGIAIGYDRLREACQTGLDGTSIDTLEEVAVELGLDAEQVMLPPDDLFLPATRSLPALVVVAGAQGVTHFVVIWRRHGRWLQVMDPGSGRRWTTCAALAAELYLHRTRVPAAAWREWAASSEAIEPLDGRLRALGLEAGPRQKLMQGALADPTWRGLADLDAAARLAGSLAAAGALRRGSEAALLIERCVTAAEEPMLARYRMVEPADGAADGVAVSSVAVPGEDEDLWLTGAVLLRVRGRRAPAEGERVAAGRPLAPELAAALAEPAVRPGRQLWRLVAAEGLRRPALLAAGLLAATLAVVAEALFFRGLLELGGRLVMSEQRLAAGFLLLLFLLVLVPLEVALYGAMLHLGRRLEIRLRHGLLTRIPLLGDRYFASRLHSDMAERCHSVHRLRLGPELAASIARCVFQLVFTASALVWLDPRMVLPAAASAVLAVGLPLLWQPVLAERDLRMRSHSGALGRFYLDALLGLQPLRCHVAEQPVRREHEALLLEWVRSAFALERGAIALEMASTLAGYGLAAAMVALHLGPGGEPAQALLVAFWALNIPILGQQLALLGRQVPVQQNTARRLLEPLSAVATEAEEARSGAGAAAASAPVAPGVALALAGVTVVAGGHTLIAGASLEIPAGMHLALVGPSGAGKSTLLGVLLGWHQPAEGGVTADGRPLAGEVLAELRGATAWVDPAVQLWNRPLLDNLIYGGGKRAAGRLGEVREAALLGNLLESLPDGFATPLGEGGALVSGGEGQRVRLGRMLTRDAPRLVLLDEPFRGLERATRRQLLDQARERWRQATLICVTHDLGHSRDFDQVAVVEDGRLAESGRPDELLARPGSRYAALLAEEERVRGRLGGEGWRRLELAGGRLEAGAAQSGREPAP